MVYISGFQMNQPGQPGFCQRNVLHFPLWGAVTFVGVISKANAGDNLINPEAKKEYLGKANHIFYQPPSPTNVAGHLEMFFSPKYTTPKLPTRWHPGFSHQLTSADFNGFIFIKTQVARDIWNVKTTRSHISGNQYS